VNLLAGAGASVTIANDKGVTAAVAAFERRFAGAARELLELGAPVDTFDADGASLLYLSVRDQQREVFDALLALGCNASIANAQVQLARLEQTDRRQRPVSLAVVHIVRRARRRCCWRVSKERTRSCACCWTTVPIPIKRTRTRERQH